MESTKKITASSEDRFLKESFEKPKYVKKGTKTGNRFVDTFISKKKSKKSKAKKSKR